MLLLQFKSPIVYLLVVAVFVSLYFQNRMEAIAILATAHVLFQHLGFQGDDAMQRLGR